jgi:hypothetical protein
MKLLRRSSSLDQQHAAADRAQVEIRGRQLATAYPETEHQKGRVEIFVPSYTNHAPEIEISPAEQRAYLLDYANVIQKIRGRRQEAVLHRTFRIEDLAQAMGDAAVTDLVFVGNGNTDILLGRRSNRAHALSLAGLVTDHLKQSVDQHMFGDYPDSPRPVPLGSYVVLDQADARVVTGLQFPSAEQADIRPQFNLHMPPVAGPIDVAKQ